MHPNPKLGDDAYAQQSAIAFHHRDTLDQQVNDFGIGLLEEEGVLANLTPKQIEKIRRRLWVTFVHAVAAQMGNPLGADDWKDELSEFQPSENTREMDAELSGHPWVDKD